MPSAKTGAASWAWGTLHSLVLHPPTRTLYVGVKRWRPTSWGRDPQLRRGVEGGRGRGIQGSQSLELDRGRPWRGSLGLEPQLPALGFSPSP